MGKTKNSNKPARGIIEEVADVAGQKVEGGFFGSTSGLFDKPELLKTLSISREDYPDTQEGMTQYLSDLALNTLTGSSIIGRIKIKPDLKVIKGGGQGQPLDKYDQIVRKRRMDPGYREYSDKRLLQKFVKDIESIPLIEGTPAEQYAEWSNNVRFLIKQHGEWKPNQLFSEGTELVSDLDLSLVDRITRRYKVVDEDVFLAMMDDVSTPIGQQIKSLRAQVGRGELSEDMYETLIKDIYEDTVLESMDLAGAPMQDEIVRSYEKLFGKAIKKQANKLGFSNFTKDIDTGEYWAKALPIPGVVALGSTQEGTLKDNPETSVFNKVKEVHQAWKNSPTIGTFVSNFVPQEEITPTANRLGIITNIKAFDNLSTPIKNLAMNGNGFQQIAKTLLRSSNNWSSLESVFDDRDSKDKINYWVTKPINVSNTDSVPDIPISEFLPQETINQIDQFEKDPKAFQMENLFKNFTENKDYNNK